MILSHRAAILIWLLGLAVAGGILLQTRFTSDMSAFLPRSPEPAQRVLVDQLRDGVASRLILIGIEGATPAARADISRRFARDLREDKDFARVDNGDGGIGTADQSYVWHNRYLLGPAVTANRFSTAGLRQALGQDLAMLSSGLEPMFKDSLGHDPTGEMLDIVHSIAGNSGRRTDNGVWVSPDASRALILAQTLAPGFDLDAQEQALKEIGHAFAHAQQPGARLLVSGPGKFGVTTRAQMKHDISLCSTLAVAAIVGLLLLVYRSPTILALTLLPVATGALVGVAAVSLCFGFVHGLTLGFGVTLIGEAVDYTVYLFAQTSRQDGPRATLARIWPTLRLGVSVSICGFAAMLFSSFTGFAQLGIFTIAGLITALAVTRFVLPHLIPAGFAGIRETGFALRLVRGARRLRWPLIILVGGAAILIVWRHGDLWQDELSSMSPVSAADQSLDRDLRRDIGAPDVRYVVVATAPSQEMLLQTSERTAAVLQRLVPSGALSGYDSPDRYLPSDATQSERRAALPDRRTLVRNLGQALAGLPFRPGIFGPFLDDVEAARNRPLLTRASLDGTALSLKLESLLIDRHGAWAAVMPLYDVADPQRIAGMLMGAGGAGSEVEFLDLKAQSDLLLHRYRREALLLAAFGAAAISVLLLASLRSVRESLIVLAPLGCAVVGTVALLTLRHGQLSIFNIFGLLLVVAVGSNYCLFFQRGGMHGATGARTATSLLLANLCTVIGFGTLSISHIPVLSGIGGTVALGTALSLAAGAILAPERAGGVR